MIPEQQRGDVWAPVAMIVLASSALAASIIGAVNGGDPVWESRLPYMVADVALIGLGVYWLWRRRR